LDLNKRLPIFTQYYHLEKYTAPGSYPRTSHVLEGSRGRRERKKRRRGRGGGSLVLCKEPVISTPWTEKQAISEVGGKKDKRGRVKRGAEVASIESNSLRKIVRKTGKKRGCSAVWFSEEFESRGALLISFFSLEGKRTRDSCN